MDELATISFGADEALELKRRAVQANPYADRVSRAFAIELLWRYDNREDYWPLLDAMSSLEGITPLSNLEGAKQFRHAPLAPLWKVHYFAPRHILQNLGAHWLMGKGGSKEFHALETQYPPDQLAHRFAIGGFEVRSCRRLTGDWVIFAKWQGQNYYLGSAAHEEGAEQNAPGLLERLRKSCEAEFPFCFSQPESQHAKTG